MSKFNYLIKIYGYKIIGIFFLIYPVAFSIKNAFQFNKNLSDAILVSIALSIFSILLYVFIKHAFDLKIIAPKLLIQKPKIIKHSELGYFSLYFFDGVYDNKPYVRIYKQRILYLKYIDYVKIHNSDDIVERIKKVLDYEYQEKIRRTKDRNKHNEKDFENDKRNSDIKDKLNKWDGYLDNITRRDDKIKSIIKK